MLESFDIKKENGEEVLYCYVTYDYEFGSDFFSNLKKNGIKNQIQDWITKNQIAFHGKKVVIVASGIAIASFLLHDIPKQQVSNTSSFSSPAIVETISSVPSSNDEEEFEPTQIEQIVLENQNENQENIPSSTETPTNEVNPPTIAEKLEPTPLESPVQVIEQEPPAPIIENPITIYRNGVPTTLAFEDYITGVVAAEMPASFHTSALQAQAILARTYALKRVEEGKRLTDSTDTQVYYDENQLRAEWGSSFDLYWNKVKEACQSTKGQTLQYHGAYIDAVYHSTSNGKTEAARNVWGYEIPYLQSVDSHWDYNTTFYANTVYKDMNQLIQLFGIANLEEGDIEILSRNESGRVSEIRIQNQTYQGVDLRSILGLRSSDFDISVENGNLVITTRGWGHGVGMSQYGANGMAKEGYTYAQILSHYYPGTTISY